MKKWISITVLLTSLLPRFTFSQSIEIEGDLTIENASLISPPAGTIRWTGQDFEGWNGSQWISLTGYARLGSLQDIEGNQYVTIRIGYQEWMMENLKVSTLNDNSDFDQIQDPGQWSLLDKAAWCWYENKEENEEVYGKLYNWYTVNTGKLCPIGWQVGSDAEWMTLINSHGAVSNAGVRMKDTVAEFWKNSSEPGMNERGFRARGGGYRNAAGSFNNMLYNGYFWTSSSYDMSNAWFQILYFDQSKIDAIPGDKRYGLSVRCFRSL